MNKYLNAKNLCNLLLFIWCVSIPFKNAIYQISTVLIVLFFMVYIIKYKEYSYLKELFFKFKELVIAFSFIITSMTISNIVNDVSSTDAWRLELVFILRYALIFIALIYFYSKSFFDKKTFTIFLFLSLSIQCLDGVYQSILGYDLFTNNFATLKTGINGAIGNRNTYGFLMGLGFILSFVSLFKNKKVNFNSLYLVVSLLFFTFYVLFSYSRAVWVSLFIGLLIYILSQSKYLKAIYIIYMIVFFSIIYIILINVPSLSSRIDDLISLNTSSRDLIWLRAIELIKEQPIFGFGLDTWKIYGAVNYNGVHNSILEILVFIGFVGLISFFSVLYITIKNIFINKQWELLFIIVFLFITSQFGHSIFKSKIFLSVTTILMFYVYSIKVEKDLEYIDK
jgi:O-antigen ligase